MVKENYYPITKKERKVKHIISSLYKIKKINRRKEYSIPELQNIIFNNKIGKEVIKQLKQENVTGYWFRLFDQEKLADIFEEKL